MFADAAKQHGQRVEIAAAICTYQRYDLLPDAIASLLQQSVAPARYRIIVVDNSPDAAASMQWSRRWSGEPNLLWLHERTAGLANARNVATEAANAPIVAFIDDDAVASPDWLAALSQAFQRLGPAAQIVGGRVRPRFGAPRPAWLDDKLQSYLSVCDLGEETRFLQPGEWVVGVNIAYRTEALRKAGGFNTALGRVGSGAALMSNDETEVQDRIEAGGGRTAYTPDAEVEHFIPAERLTQEWFRRRMAWQAVSDYVRAPQRMRAGAAESWLRLKDYLASCSPADRTMRALVLPQAEAGPFTFQMSAVYETMVALLGHAETEAELD
jgi:GT2 family glycosyltransferase